MGVNIKDVIVKVVLSCSAVIVLFACKGRVESGDSQDYYDDYGDPEVMMAKFIERVESDTNTFNYDLEDEANALGIDIQTSPDKRIKIYNWISGGGTSPSWGNVTQFRNDNGEIVCYSGLPIVGDDADYTVTDILMANNLKKRPIYFFVFYAKALSSEGYDALCAAEIQNGRIVQDQSSSIVVM